MRSPRGLPAETARRCCLLARSWAWIASPKHCTREAWPQARCMVASHRPCAPRPWLSSRTARSTCWSPPMSPRAVSTSMASPWSSTSMPHATPRTTSTAPAAQHAPVHREPWSRSLRQSSNAASMASRPRRESSRQSAGFAPLMTSWLTSPVHSSHRASRGSRRRKHHTHGSTALHINAAAVSRAAAAGLASLDVRSDLSAPIARPAQYDLSAPIAPSALNGLLVRTGHRRRIGRPRQIATSDLSAPNVLHAKLDPHVPSRQTAPVGRIDLTDRFATSDTPARRELSRQSARVDQIGRSVRSEATVLPARSSPRGHPVAVAALRRRLSVPADHVRPESMMRMLLALRGPQRPELSDTSMPKAQRESRARAGLAAPMHAHRPAMGWQARSRDRK